MRIKFIYLDIEVPSSSAAAQQPPVERHWLLTASLFIAQRVAAAGVTYLATELFKRLL